jgi:hypothetical protein
MWLSVCAYHMEIASFMYQYLTEIATFMYQYFARTVLALVMYMKLQTIVHHRCLQLACVRNAFFCLGILPEIWKVTCQLVY